MPKVSGKTVRKAFCGLLAAYVLVYAALSICGSYQPGAVDLRGVMWYEWAPLGFYDSNHLRDPKNLGWNPVMEYAFLPLLYIDGRFIHKWSFDGKSPERK